MPSHYGSHPAVTSDMPDEKKEELADDLVTVCMRKRPLFRSEASEGEIDGVTCNARGDLGLCTLHFHTTKLTGEPIVKDKLFHFDRAFGEAASNEDVYSSVLKPKLMRLLHAELKTVTAFAYGQTGSGKTHTMAGLQNCVARDLFAELPRVRVVPHDDRAPEDEHCPYSTPKVMVSMFELLGSECFDLFNNKNPVFIRQDVEGDIHVRGLTKLEVTSASQLLNLVHKAGQLRATAATGRNATSSRSHAVCKITLHYPMPPPVLSAAEQRRRRIVARMTFGRKAGAAEVLENVVVRSVTLVDLAGSEGNRDSARHSKARRKECTEINKSLMSLKECIRFRAMDSEAHVPYRGSRLTLLLKDSFEAGGAHLHRTVMLCMVSPMASDYAHSLNTVRYADSFKTKVSVVEPVVGVNDPRRWGRKRVLRFLAHECCAEGAASFSGVAGKQLCFMHQGELEMRCRRHGASMYKRLHETLRKAKKAIALAAAREAKAAGEKPVKAMPTTKVAVVEPVAGVDDPRRWGRRRVQRFLEGHCCAEGAGSFAGVAGKQLCFMHQGELEARCPHHGAALYDGLNEMVWRAKKAIVVATARQEEAAKAGAAVVKPVKRARKKWMPPSEWKK